ncbi:DUF1203 domain-containing protein [uncultured Brevundimonas sp.]|mgnify:FL=1|uniref:DUF1203 domain-containing protein n=1 Tax=uncultured Brevundimonas sp. TaxID=213418 RepID=UPI0030EDAE2E|tara:strand:- start:64 stop:537 length:474 start_codon:yes stop_codon:yes gene_type:complete
MTYAIEALPLAPFAPLLALSDDALIAVGARRMVADSPHSAPCRVSLVDADPGDRLILTHHIHLDAPASPYRAGGPVFVRETAVEATPVIGVVPDLLERRLLSARVYDADGMMTDADVVEGTALDARLRLWLANPVTAQVQLHTARRGCYLARAVRQD